MATISSNPGWFWAGKKKHDRDCISQNLKIFQKNPILIFIWKKILKSSKVVYVIGMSIASLGTMPGVFGDSYVENQEGENFWRLNKAAYRESVWRSS